MANVKVYSTEYCPYCVALKEFLKESHIEFQAIDVAEDLKAQEDMIERSGQMGVPVIEIDGQMIVGFDREKISQILEIRN